MAQKISVSVAAHIAEWEGEFHAASESLKPPARRIFEAGEAAHAEDGFWAAVRAECAVADEDGVRAGAVRGTRTWWLGRVRKAVGTGPGQYDDWAAREAAEWSFRRCSLSHCVVVHAAAFFPGRRGRPGSPYHCGLLVADALLRAGIPKKWLASAHRWAQGHYRGSRRSVWGCVLADRHAAAIDKWRVSKHHRRAWRAIWKEWLRRHCTGAAGWADQPNMMDMAALVAAAPHARHHHEALAAYAAWWQARPETWERDALVAVWAEDPHGHQRRWWDRGIIPRPEGYPAVSPEQGAAIYRGEYTMLAPDLTPAECRQWLREKPEASPLDWLRAKAFEGACTYGTQVTEPDILRWVAAVRKRGDWGQLTRPRQCRVDGEAVEYTFLDHIGDVIPADLAGQGLRAGVSATFRRAAERTGVENLAEALSDHRRLAAVPSEVARVLKVWSRLTPLTTAHKLAVAGKELRLCCGQSRYADRTRNGEILLFRLTVPGTADHVFTLSMRDQRIVEFRAPGNASPHKVARRHVAAFCAAIGAKLVC